MLHFVVQPALQKGGDQSAEQISLQLQVCASLLPLKAVSQSMLLSSCWQISIVTGASFDHAPV